MHLIQKRLFECMGTGRSTWSEPDSTKRVCSPAQYGYVGQ